MPIVTVSGPPLEVEQKRQLASGLTKVMCEVYGRPAEQIIVVIRENQPENVAIGGKLVVDRRGQESCSRERRDSSLRSE